MPSKDRVEALVALVEQGRFIEALESFYTDDAAMQENFQPPRRGLPALIETERHIMGAYREIRTRSGSRFLVDGDCVVINWVFEFVEHGGRTFTFDELAWQRWEGDRIAEERFYYDPAQREGGTHQA